MRRDSIYLKIAVVVLIGVLIVWRRPEFFIEPRFWAEEGQTYFADAWNMGFWRGIVMPHFGYYAIVPSVATALSTLLTLEQAPLLTTCIACLFQILVSSIVVFGNSPYWDTWLKKLMIAIGIQLINAPEVWLTTISVQYWMCIAAFFILLEQEESASIWWKQYLRGMLAIAGMSSPISLFLTPVFFIKAWGNRTREAWIQVCILGIAGVVQAAVLLGSFLSKDSHIAMRFGGNGFGWLNILRMHLVEPFSGNQIFSLSPIVTLDGKFYYWLSYQGLIPDSWPRLSQLALLVALTVYVLSLFVRDLYFKQQRMIPLAFLLVSVLSILLSLKMASAPRYAFAPSAMLLVLFVNEALEVRRTVWKAAGVATIFLIIIGCYSDFRTRMFTDQNWPNWKQEVAVWRTGQTDRMYIWPQFRRASWFLEIRHK